MKEHERLEKIDDELMKNTILEMLCIKEINSEIFDETKVLDEIEERLFGMTCKITKTIHWITKKI